MTSRFLRRFFALVAISISPAAQNAPLPKPERIRLAGIEKPVEILRDRWGVPHIYAQNARDLFFAQGYMAARDRMFQLDLWRRINSGSLAEIQGPAALGRDRIARLVRFRGDWDAEWRAYSPDARQIAIDFTRGINAWIDSRTGRDFGVEFRLAGYAPGKWVPEDVVARVAGLLMTRNVAREVDRALEIQQYGLETAEQIRPPDPFRPLRPPAGLDLKSITAEILRDYTAAIGGARVDAVEGSNNWVVDGTMSVTGKPLLANDPHRPIQIPSLRKTVHLVAPGWNVLGAGEPALPGIALGHNEEIAFGFTIVGIDQSDLYVERVNPRNDREYWHQGAWRRMEIEKTVVPVKGRASETMELRYTVHGPVLYQDHTSHRAFALRWVGAEPGGAGYLGALALSRARNWKEFLAAAANYKVPSENLVYADRAGNIGWLASGWAPVRKGYDGLLPVPGDREDYGWTGYLPVSAKPQEYNPPRHWIATANHNILPKGYPHALSFEWAPPFRYQRIVEMLAEKPKFSIADFERMQQDVTNTAARRLVAALGKLPGAGSAPWARLLRWDGRMTADSIEAALFAVWTARLGEELYGSPAGARMELGAMLERLEQKPDPGALRRAWERTIAELTQALGPDQSQWQWGKLHTVQFQHAIRLPASARTQLNRGPLARPGDGNTVNATGGANFRQTSGASYRQILDLADWDRSVMTNVPGESGDPSSPHYADLLEDWANGRYHPMPYSRRAVEQATRERIVLTPAATGNSR